MKLLLFSVVFALNVAHAEDSHTSVANESGRETNTFSAYETIATKMETWSKSMADGEKSESVDKNVLKLKPSKADFLKASELLKRIKYYRGRIAEACEIADPSVKDLGTFMDSCISEGMFAEAIEKASKLEERWEMSLSLKRLAECKAHINAYFAAKDGAMNEIDHDRYKTDWELQEKFNEFFDLFAPKAGLATVDTSKSKLVASLKKVPQGNWCQVDPGKIEKKATADTGTFAQGSGGTGAADTTVAKKELDGTLGKAASTADAGYGKKAGESVGKYGNCSTGNCSGGYKPYAKGGEYAYGSGGYGAGGNGNGYGNCNSGKCGGYNYDPSQYKFDPQDYKFDPNDYRYDPRQYEGGGGYSGLNPGMFYPKKDYDKPHYAQPAPYIPPPPPIDEPRNNPYPYYPPRAYQPPPLVPFVPFLPPPPPPPIIPRSSFRLIETETRRPYVIPTCPTIGNPCSTPQPSLLPPWMIPGVNPLGNPAFPGQFPRTGIPGIPPTIPGMPGGPITIPRTGNPNMPPTLPPSVPPTINPTWPPTTPTTPTWPTIPTLPTIPPTTSNPTWPTVPTNPGGNPTVPTLPTLPGGSTSGNVNNTGNNGTVVQVPRGARR